MSGKYHHIKTAPTPEMQAKPNKMARMLHEELGNMELSFVDRMGLLIALSLRIFREQLEREDMPPGLRMTIESLADGLRDSLVASWKATAQRRDQ